MTGVSWRPPPRRLAGPALHRPVAGGGRWGGGVAGRALGGEAAERMGVPAERMGEAAERMGEGEAAPGQSHG